MAIYTTFFLCRPEQLAVGFPGWKLPLPEPKSRRTINPFTREEMTVTSRAPEWDDFDPKDYQLPERRVVMERSDYESYLEQRIPAFVQSQPHWCSKNLTTVELEPLVGVVTGVTDPHLQTPLYAHPKLGKGIEALPDELLARLAAADDDTLRAIAQEWAAQMSTPDYTHSISGKRLQDDWTLDEALTILKPICELAKQRTNGQSLYFLVEA